MTLASRIAGLLLLICLAWAAIGRIELLAAFHGYFGASPLRPSLASWLDEAGAPDDRRIIASLQSYVPKRFNKLVDGLWHPSQVEQFLFGVSQLPAVYVEDAYYFELFFDSSMRSRSRSTPAQTALYESGREFYSRLESGRARPFVLAQIDWEEADTNNLLNTKSADFHRILIYANRFAFSENLAASAEFLSKSASVVKTLRKPSSLSEMDEPGLAEALLLRWPFPVTIQDIHAGLKQPSPQPLKLAIVAADGHVLESKFEPPDLRYHRGGETERFVFRDHPVECSELSISSADGRPIDLAMLREIAAIAPAPLGINAISTFFEFAGNEPGEWKKAMGWRPPGAGASDISLRPGEKRKLSLLARADRPAAITELLLVFDGPASEARAECGFILADGAKTRITGRLLHSRMPAVSWLSFSDSSGKAVKSMEIDLEIPDDAGEPSRLVQIGAHLSPISTR